MTVLSFFSFNVFKAQLISFFFRLRNAELPVKVSKTISCSLGGKQRLINIQVSAAEQQPTFKKDGNNIAYMLPSNFSILENGNNHIKQ